ncbi:MAG: AAA family ATPase, partial [Methylocystis sp.]|nr:AAA family ATPase [Methylocystis sp.]
MTTLFVDLVGYTALTEQLDPEDLRLLQRRYQNLALQVMERYGGFIARYVGDGILVYFGYPTNHENDAERAVRAALELNERLHELESDFRQSINVPIKARIGINTGLVLLAPELLSGGAIGRGAIGEAVNLASRLQAEASPGGVAISRETYELIEGVFECKLMGARSLKGFSRDVTVYEVVRLLPGASKTAQRSGAMRMVGRDAAIERLHARWAVARDSRQCQIIQVRGEAGIGKTRLIQEFCTSPALAEATILRANCHELFASTPLYPVASYLWTRISLTSDDYEQSRLAKITHYLDEINFNSPANMSIIASFLGLSDGEAAATPHELKRKQFDFLISVFQQAMRFRPMLLWVEDAHWIDATSAELMFELVKSLAAQPLAILYTTRTFPKGPALPEADEEIELHQLDDQLCCDLVKGVPGADVLTDAMIARVVEAAEGVPLFLEQFALGLIESEAKGGGSKAKQIDLPLKLGEMISERLDRRPGGRTIMQAAACIGRSFTPAFLAKLLHEAPSDIEEPLQALVEAEILLPRRSGQEIRFEFRHSLLQRVAYESIARGEKALLHEQIVQELKSDGSATAMPE